MIVWSSKEEREHGIAFPSVGARSWRWVFDVSLTCIDLRQEVKFPSGDWRHGARWYTLSLTEHFRLGPHHVWYDGPNCFFSFGFLHFAYRNERCTKCEGEI